MIKSQFNQKLSKHDFAQKGLLLNQETKVWAYCVRFVPAVHPEIVEE